MLGSLRNFSSSIYAKVLLGIVIIPFVFWGMGSNFVGGNKNIVLRIDKDKYSIQEFGQYIEKYTPNDQVVDDNYVKRMLSSFVGEKLLEKEIEYHNIKISDQSLYNLIRNQKEFKRNDEFSRIEYEKFLIENNLSAVNFEENLLKKEKKKQLLEFIGGGIYPPEFLVNNTYNQINEKRNIQLVDLTKVFEKKLIFTEDQIISYYNDNSSEFTNIYKTMKLVELNPKILIDADEFNSLFFKKVDEVDDMIAQGDNFNSIINKFNIENFNTYRIDSLGRNTNFIKENQINDEIVKVLFNIDNSDPTILLENNNKYFVIELGKTEDIKMNIEKKETKDKSLKLLKKDKKTELISNIISKINSNQFKKIDFDTFIQNENVKPKKINLKDKLDYRILKKEIVNEIYNYQGKRVVVVNDLSLSEAYLIYIDKIESVTINRGEEEYNAYSNLAKFNIKGDLFNTYDAYLKAKYEIEINYKTLSMIKNYFN